MSTNKVDVSINYYGKPYQTLVTLLTLWRHSRQHIGTIYIVIERQQPYGQYGSIRLLQWALQDLPIHYYFANQFYYHGSPAIDSLSDPKIRYDLKYQYGLEKTNKRYHFLSHNDCLYEDDLLGSLLAQVESSNEIVAGVGLIGQCWNCPAFSAQLCDGSRFEEFRPTGAQNLTLVDRYKPPRAKIHYALIETGYNHPLPECRLNEYACLVNAEQYKALTLPRGKMLPLGAAWHGTDWGAVWFHDMVNAGYKFINFPFEPKMTHAPFTPTKSGHTSDRDSDEYFKIESKARQYLAAEFPDALVIPISVRIAAWFYQGKATARRFPEKLKSAIRGILR